MNANDISLSQLADPGFANQSEIDAIVAIHPQLKSCQKEALEGLSQTTPSIVPILAASYTKGDDDLLLLEDLIERLAINCDAIALPGEQPASATSWLFAALSLQKLGRDAEALTAINAALELKPKNAFMHLVAGELYDTAGQLADAEAEYRFAAAMQPDVGNTMALAGIYRRQGRVDDEIAALHRAIDLSRVGPLIPAMQMLTAAEARATQRSRRRWRRRGGVPDCGVADHRKSV